MRRAQILLPAFLVGLMLSALAVGKVLDSEQEDVNSEARSETRFLPGVGDYELFPFLDFLRISEGVVEGEVIDVSDPKWNLPQGEKFDPEKDYQWDPLTFRTVTVRVERWIHNDGSFSGSEVVLTVPGGRIEKVLTREEIIEFADLGHHPDVDPYEVVPGGIIYAGDDLYGGLTFQVGERVALLINRTNFTTPAEVIGLPQVTGYSAGKFLIGADGALRNEVVSQPDAPKSMTELEELVRQVKGSS